MTRVYALIMVCLHRAGYCSDTKSQNLLLLPSIFRQWRSQFYPRFYLLTVVRPQVENALMTAIIRERRPPVGQPMVDRLSTVVSPARPRGANGKISIVRDGAR